MPNVRNAHIAKGARVRVCMQASDSCLRGYASSLPLRSRNNCPPRKRSALPARPLAVTPSQDRSRLSASPLRRTAPDTNNDRQQDRLRLLKGVAAPRAPMHGIVAMLAKKGVVSREGVRSSCNLTPIDQQHPRSTALPTEKGVTITEAVQRGRPSPS
jgi:hypothetical protein